MCILKYCSCKKFLIGHISKMAYAKNANFCLLVHIFHFPLPTCRVSIRFYTHGLLSLQIKHGWPGCLRAALVSGETKQSVFCIFLNNKLSDILWFTFLLNRLFLTANCVDVQPMVRVPNIPSSLRCHWPRPYLQ